MHVPTVNKTVVNSEGCSNRDYWAYGLCPSSGSLKRQRSKNFIYLRPHVRGWETPILLRHLERANLNHRPVIPSVIHHPQKPLKPRTF
jgi:hypothetical protein